MRKTYECGTKARLSFSGGPHTPANMAYPWKKWMKVEKNRGNGILQTSAQLYCAIFQTPHFHKSLKFFRTSIASLDPETVKLPAFSILSAMFTEVCGPPEKLSLTLVSHSNVLRTIVKLAYWCKTFSATSTPSSLQRVAYSVQSKLGKFSREWGDI